MGATRWVITISAVAIGAGTLLALAITPSFAPYQDRETLADPSEMNNAPFVALPHAQPQRESGPSSYEMETEPEDDYDDSNSQFGPKERGFFLVLPRWMAEQGGWMGRGQRVWREWMGPDEPTDDHDQRRRPPRQHYGYDDGYDATVERFAPPRAYRPQVEDTPRYSRDNRLPEQTEAPAAAIPPTAVERQPRTEAARPPVQPPADAAAIAAARAREAVRDVYAAEAAGQ